MFVVRCTTTCAGLLSWAMIRVRYCRMLQSVEFCLTHLTLESVILQEYRLFASLIKICFACGGQETVQSQLTVRPGFEPRACLVPTRRGVYIFSMVVGSKQVRRSHAVAAVCHAPLPVRASATRFLA